MLTSLKSGASTLHWSGSRPRTTETVKLLATLLRRLTWRLRCRYGYIPICVCVLEWKAETLQEPLTPSIGPSLHDGTWLARRFVTHLQRLSRLSWSLCCVNWQEVGPEERGRWDTGDSSAYIDPDLGFKLLWTSCFSLCLPLSHQEWFTVYEHNRRPICTVSDLVMGNEYSFRVFSENICGLSDVPCVSKNTAIIAKTGDEVPAEHCTL